MLVYRVADLAARRRRLAERGWKPERIARDPAGSVSSFRSPGGHRIAVYQLRRPEVLRHFEGRRDF